MKGASFSIRCLTLGLAPLVFLASCGDPQKNAEKSLEKRDIEFTPGAFLAAASAGDEAAIDLFLEAGMEVDATDAKGNTALIRAAENGQSGTVEKLLGLGADPRHANGLGRDALIMAAGKGYVETARLLLGRGANSRREDVEGWDALSLAGYKGHARMVSLLTADADQEGLDNALLVSSFTGDTRVLQHLLNQGAYINTRSPENQTPLMIASKNGRAEAVRLLLQNQANHHATDSGGNTAAQLARAAGHGEIHDLIGDPGRWGESPVAKEIAEEVNEALDAIAQGQGAEETLRAVPVGSAVPVATEEIAASPAPLRATPVRVDSVAEPPGTDGAVSEPVGNLVEVTPAASAENPSAAGTDVEKHPLPRKPMAALNGSVIRSRSPKMAAVETFALASYRERPLPIALSDVDEDSAEVRLLGREGEGPIRVRPGETIPGTGYRVSGLTRKHVDSKEGQGQLMDVSQISVEDVRTGSTHVLVKEMPGTSSDSFAILTSPNSDYRYVVRTGDVFHTEQPEAGEKDYQVLDIRPSGVVIKDLATGHVSTLSRDGLRQP